MLCLRCLIAVVPSVSLISFLEQVYYYHYYNYYLSPPLRRVLVFSYPIRLYNRTITVSIPSPPYFMNSFIISSAPCRISILEFSYTLLYLLLL